MRGSRIQLPSVTAEWSPKKICFGVFIPRHFRGRLLSLFITQGQPKVQTRFRFQFWHQENQNQERVDESGWFQKESWNDFSWVKFKLHPAWRANLKPQEEGFSSFVIQPPSM